MSQQVLDSAIEQSDDVLGGTAVFAGTRVPIQALLDYVAAGDRIDDFLEDFPTVSREAALRVLRITQPIARYGNGC